MKCIDLVIEFKDGTISRFPINIEGFLTWYNGENKEIEYITMGPVYDASKSPKEAH